MRESIYSYPLKLKRKIKEKKMSKAIEENKLTVTIKKIMWEFSLYWKFMCMDKTNDKNKASLPHPLSLHSSYCFPNSRKTTKPKKNFLDF